METKYKEYLIQGAFKFKMGHCYQKLVGETMLTEYN